jgi:hypothetical protein
MAIGLYVLPDGSVMVAYGPRHIPISRAQYRANGYKPVLEKLVAKSPGGNGPPVGPEATCRDGAVTLPCEKRERSTPYGFLGRRDGLAPRGHRRGA